jgi:V8-like Glu-specific endopeptidase
MREPDPQRTRRYRQRRRRYAAVSSTSAGAAAQDSRREAAAPNGVKPTIALRSRLRSKRRFTAATLCLGVLAIGAVLGFFAEQKADARGAVGSAHTTPRAVPAPWPQSGRLIATLSPITRLDPQSGLKIAPQGTGRSTGSGTFPPAVPATKAGTGVFFGGALQDQSTLPAMTQSDPLTGTAFTGLPQVGALFGYDGSSTSSHFCSASVVASDAGDLVITAAHCVYDSSSGSPITDIAFVPGYHDGQQPYGVWTPSQIVVAPQWINDQDPDYDVAFLVVHQPGSTQRIQDAVGADQLGVDSGFAALTQVVGYPSGVEQPITCTDYTKQFSPTQLEFDCPGYPDGTSGGPFLTDVDPQTGVGTVVGVIGGYETGGDTPDVSYSAYFNDAIHSLFQRAEAAG